MARLDPLGLDARPPPPELDPASYGFTDADLDREFYLGEAEGKGGEWEGGGCRGAAVERGAG